jgi:hypothetical protein
MHKMPHAARAAFAHPIYLPVVKGIFGFLSVKNVYLQKHSKVPLPDFI